MLHHFQPTKTHNQIRITNLGVTHESLPDHQGRKDDHCKVQQLKEKLALVCPELLELQHLFVDYVFNHIV
jgi:hypothetical protein